MTGSKVCCPECGFSYLTSWGEHAVSLDGVLVGSWPDWVEHDLCTGCGLHTEMVVG